MFFIMLKPLSILMLCLVMSSAAAMAPTAEPPASTPAASESDQAFSALDSQFQKLRESLTAVRGIGDAERKPVIAFRDRVHEFNQRWPKHVRGLTMELVLSQWLKDNERVDELCGELIALRSDDASLRASWAEYDARNNMATKYNDFPAALARLEHLQFDKGKFPHAAKWLADSLFAEHRFEEARTAYQAIPADALNRDRDLSQAVGSVLTSISEYPKLWEKEQELRAAEASSAEPLPQVELWTVRGRIVVELFENEAPNTVANFINLTEDGFYKKMKFHRVIPNFMAQVGDPSSREGAESGTPDGPGYTIVDEHTREDHRNHFSGTLSMANKSMPNTGGSQFFLTVTPTPWLNGKHTVFGRVVEGLDVVRNLRQGDVLETARVLRKRNHDYVPAKLTAPVVNTSPAEEPVKMPP